VETPRFQRRTASSVATALSEDLLDKVPREGNLRVMPEVDSFERLPELLGNLLEFDDGQEVCVKSVRSTSKDRRW